MRASRLEPALIERVRLRESLINGCAFCVGMHSKDARAKGGSEQRLFALPVWQETPFFSSRERVSRQPQAVAEGVGVRAGVLMGATEPVRSASHAVLRQLRESCANIRALLTLPRLRMLNGLDGGRSFEISMVCELLGQRAMDKRNRDRPFTDCRCHAFDASAPNVTHGEHAWKRGFEQIR